MDFLTMNFRLFRLFGTEVRIHISFLLLMVFIAVQGMDRFIMVMMAFCFVLIHEFAHAGMARAFGRYCDKIYLHFFGGAANISPIGTPYKDLLVAFAGPASNAIMGGAFYLMGGRFGIGSLLDMCFTINVVIGMFNMFPIWPLDGGRILINLLKMMGLSSARASDITFYVTSVMIVFAIYFFRSNPINILLMILIWFSAFSTWRKGNLLSV